METSYLRLVPYSFILCTNLLYKNHLNKSKGMDCWTNYTLLEVSKLVKSEVSRLCLNDETVDFWYMHLQLKKKKKI